MMLGLDSKEQMNVKFLTGKVPLRNLAIQLQGRRLNQWASLYGEDETLIKMLLKSYLPIFTHKGLVKATLFALLWGINR